MKKIITILVLLSFAGTGVFANAPATVQTDMFTDVSGTTLSDKEMDEADGGMYPSDVGFSNAGLSKARAKNDSDYKKLQSKYYNAGVHGRIHASHSTTYNSGYTVTHGNARAAAQSAKYKKDMARSRRRQKSFDTLRSQRRESNLCHGTCLNRG